MNSLFLSFVPGDSLLHRLDPRTKLVALMVASIYILNLSSLAHILFFTFLFMFLATMCKIPFMHFIRSVRPMLLFFVLIFLLQLLFTDGTHTFRIKWLTVSYEGLILGTLLVSRFVFLLLFAALLTATTSPSMITTGLERLLRPLPLRYLGVSSHDIAMMMSLSIYFVPLMYDNFKDLKDAQLSRGLNVKKNPFKTILAFSVPLINNSIRSVEDVSLAMESRCYRGTGRTSVHIMAFKGMDLIVLSSLAISSFFYLIK